MFSLPDLTSWVTGSATEAPEGEERSTEPRGGDGEEAGDLMGRFSGWVESATGAINDGIQRVTAVVGMELTPRSQEEQSPEKKEGLTDTVMDPPAEWTHSPGGWTFLLTTALEKENFCRYSVQTLLEKEEVEGKGKVKTLLKELLGGEWESDCRRDLNEEGSCVPSETFIAWLTETVEVYATFSRLVPALLTEEQYFTNIGGKIHLLRRCQTPPQLLQLAKCLSEVETQDSEQDWETVYQKVCALEEEWTVVRNLQKEIEETIQQTEGNAKLLETLLAKGETTTPLAESVRESCAYQEEKLQRLLERVKSHPRECEGTVLDANSGRVYKELNEMMGVLQHLRQRCEEGAQSTSALVEDEAATQKTSPPEDSSFQAQLPWEDDEEGL